MLSGGESLADFPLLKAIAEHSGDAQEGGLASAIGLDQFVFKGMSNFMDFRQNDKPPLEIMERATTEAMTNLVALRDRDYPAKKPIDGAMITMSAIGIYGNPAGLTSVRHVTLQCADGNPRFGDFGALYAGMHSRRSP